MATLAAERRLRKQLADLRKRLGRSVAPFADTSDRAARRRWEQTEGTDDWGRVYTPHYFEDAPAGFHADQDRMLDHDVRHVFAVHGPREHGKSARARIHLLKKLCRGELSYWLFGSEHLKISKAHLRSYKLEIEQNARLRADYAPVVDSWNEADAVLEVTVTPRATGVSHTFRLEGISYGTSAKGKLWMALRPQGAHLDDFENTRTARNREVSQAKLQWVLMELYPAVTGPILWNGNVGHDTSALYLAALRVFADDDDALRAFLRAGTPWGVSIPDRGPTRASRKAPEGSTGEIDPHPDLDTEAELSFYAYRAEYDLTEKTLETWARLYGERAAKAARRRVFGRRPVGTKAYLWEGRYAPGWYRSMRATMLAYYEGEMNGYPVRAGLFFRAEWFPRWTELPEEATWFSWMDPAFGQSKSSCYKVVVVGCTDGKRYWVVACYCRQGKPLSEAIDWWYRAFEVYGAYGLRSGRYENNFDQENRLRPDLETAAKRHGHALPVAGDPNKLDKHVRIDSLGYRAEQGQILVPASMDADMRVLWNQLMDYPDGAYEDGPDALESLVARLRHQSSSTPSYQATGARRFVRGRRAAA